MLMLWPNPLFWGPLFSRACAILFLGGALLSIKNPVWSVPAFIIILGPLQTFSKYFSKEIGEYPVTPPSMAVWLLFVIWFIRRPKATGVHTSHNSGLILGGIWIAMILGAMPAWGATPGGRDPKIITKLIFITGLFEPFLLFVVVCSWLKAYNSSRLLVNSLIISTIVALVIGIVNYNLITFENKTIFKNLADDVSSWRFHFMAFGGANLLGLILVIIYPMTFLHRRNKGVDTIEMMVSAVFLWIIAFASYSRATPIILALETVLLWVANRERERIAKVAAFLLIAGLALLLILPKNVPEGIIKRFASTDLVAYFMGTASHVSESDEYRREIQNVLWAEILHRPAGGYAATGDEDPESFLLDVALQLGWAPCLLFIGLEVTFFLIGLNLWVKKPNNLKLRVFLCMWFGFVVYSTFTGCNISKVVFNENNFYIHVNAISTLFLVTAIALYVHFLKTQEQS